MDILMIVVFLLPMLFKMSECEVTLRVFEQPVPWDAVRKRCANHTKDGCLSTESLDTWLRDSKSPDGLQPNVPVWIEARFFYKLMWAAGSPDKSDVFPCQLYFKREMTPNDTHHPGLHAPYVCYDKCYPKTVYISTQDGDCYCVARSSDPGTEVPPTYCDTFPQDTWNYSGKADIYSVYKIPSNMVFNQGFYKLSCFRAVSAGESLQFFGENCKDALPAICIRSDLQQLINLNVSGNFSGVKEQCQKGNHHFPSITLYGGGDSGLQTLTNQWKNMTPIINQFYLDITRKSSKFWMNGKTFSYKVNKDNQQSECIVLMKNNDKGIRFETRPCENQHQFICLCPEQNVETTGVPKDNENHGQTPTQNEIENVETTGVLKDNGNRGQSPTQNKIVIAIAAGVTGVVLLAIFIIVAVVLYRMKRSGKLRGRKSSITQSSSRSGEWDPGEASRTWDRSSRSTSIDYIDSKITPLVGNKSALPAIYENSKIVGSMANTAGNGNTDAENLYAVCGSPDGAENGDQYSERKVLAGADYAEAETASQKPKRSMLNRQKRETEKGDYAEPGENLYTEVSKEEGQGVKVVRLDVGKKVYDTPRAQRRNLSSEIDGTGDQNNIAKINPTSATNQAIGHSNLDRHVGPMGDIYTEVHKEAGTGVVEKVRSATSTHYKVPKSTFVAIPTGDDKKETREIGCEGGNGGTPGPLGDIYAEVKK